MSARAASKVREDGLQALLREGCKQMLSIRPLAAKFVVPAAVPIVTRDDVPASIAAFPYSQAMELVLPDSYDSNEALFEYDRLPDRFEFPQPVVHEFDEATIIEEAGFAVVESGLILESVLARRDLVDKHVIDDPRLIRKVRSAQSRTIEGQRYSTLCPMLHTSSFSKWLTKELPRLQGVHHYAEETGTDPHLLLPQDPPSYVVESMPIFGFDDDQWSTWSGDRVYADQLIVPQHPCLEHPLSLYDHRLQYDLSYKAISPPACEWVRERALEGVDGTESTERIYISREDAHERRVVNEEEVMDALEPYGFESYLLTELSFERQIELFANAECVVGPHGAGLSNIIFADECSVLEIFGKKVKPTYYMLANSAGLDYATLRQAIVGDDISVTVGELLEHRCITGLDDEK
ncbi:glycosyltransferase family 61 protein [Halorubrum sp. AD140]|uniref:glycosyltransferase family 61 protein n=1 Tax=Halorubrum sp. AD140 TaxID=3050073 RepID=UPI002ACCC441|nr:glycosyltransferase family 61 protein [Halorubrum sp. AD140]MDZ5810498.1 glycosyltransferase family 61 protein [Halorubrum sp. AD140]